MVLQSPVTVLQDLRILGASGTSEGRDLGLSGFGLWGSRGLRIWGLAFRV